MQAPQWTTEQKQCIYADGGTLLVSAAAGSGKTTVLVRRIIEKVIREKDPVDIDRLLVVTFTRAAAAEMKQRLTAALSAALAEDPTNVRLSRQLMLLPRAAISTVDGFCTTLVREQFHRLDLSPRFKVGEEGELRLLREEALTETVEQLYTEGDPAFRELAALLGSGRSDAGVLDTIGRLYDCIQAHPFPTRWLAELQKPYTRLAPIAETPWGLIAVGQFEEELKNCLAIGRSALAAAETDAQLTECYLPAIRETVSALEEFSGRQAVLSWDERRETAAALPLPSLRAVRKPADEALKNRVQAQWNQLKKRIKALPSLLCCSETEYAEDRAAQRPLIEALCRAVNAFSDGYTEKKRRRDMVDFSDLEHLALSLLVVPEEDGRLTPTPLAQELSAQYDEVLVDEYQDTNAAQDALFSALSRQEQNLFMVGDVKQSIYGFRQAMPELFLGRRNRYPLFDGEHYPGTILLGHNFRSRREVTDGVNALFRQLMTEKTGGIVYDKQEELVPAATQYAAHEGYEPELWVVSGRTEAEDSRDAAEARLIAKRIRELCGTLTVTDKTGERPARFGDFCILLRAAGVHAGAYADELIRQGIPAFTEKSGGFFEASEVLLALSLLRLIHNPLQEVPLLAALLSPVGGLIPDDLAEIRRLAPHEPFWLALRKKARETDALGQKCAAFTAFLQRMRILAAASPADRLIARLYEETGLLLREAARPHGERRVANLRLLQEYAARCEQNGQRGLSAFMRYIDRLADRDAALPSASLASGDTDAVQVMSIHRSKGLEFPFVFVAGLGGRFNDDSARGKVLLHPECGIGMIRRDPDTLVEHTTLPLQGVRQAIRRSGRTEELRVLYVALTRAKEKLILVASVPNPDKRLAELSAAVGDAPALPAHLVLDAAGMSDWILAAMLRHPSGGILRQAAGWQDPPPFAEAAQAWRVELAPPMPAEITEETCSPAWPAADEALAQELAGRFAYTYPYQTLGEIPAKAAASALSHTHAEAALAAVSRPAFLSRSGLTPAERGTAMHLFMQLARYADAAADLEGEIRRLTEEAFLSEAQADSLSRPRLRAFFKSPLYRRMAASLVCLREYPFTVTVPAERLDPVRAETLPPDARREPVVVQGIVDCLFEEDGKLVVVDYKTDQVSDAQELIDRYLPQLEWYAYALRQIREMDTAQCLLYSFALGEAIEVPLKK